MTSPLNRRLFLTASLGTAAAATLAACGGSGGDEPEVAEVDTADFPEGSTMAALAEAGAITIGTKFDQPLFGQAGPDGTPVGFDVEIGKIVAGALGISPDNITWTETVSANREPFIENGQVDLVVATYTINDTRKEVIDFAGPYYVAGQALMVLIDNEDITGEDSLAGKKVASVEGSTPAQYILDNHPDAELQTFDTYSNCVTALINGQVDVVTTDNVILAGFVAADEENLKLVGDGETFTQEPYGIGLAKGDDDFRTFINDTLEAAYEDGAWAEAWEATAGTVLPTPEPPAVDRY
ncbi:glutamate ABC transporter substrate-binding protein [Brachybacterium sp. J153]|uniref:glutamate ABC transporter substrate-binding protein n=1 Tax=Brachybacterium sp. J153 TaxID=3116488 RepID=UPI002E79DFFC|nr:glutamate ABC transporter substrate-binding protein [Brachybacterium sp. J153]MEE1618821.1 glutamate ABC transporter substrate-binding protein [Brachybacterium sp. J153]